MCLCLSLTQRGSGKKDQATAGETDYPAFKYAITYADICMTIHTHINSSYASLKNNYRIMHINTGDNAITNPCTQKCVLGALCVCV